MTDVEKFFLKFVMWSTCYALILAVVYLYIHLMQSLFTN
jgi:hypothetical protein